MKTMAPDAPTSHTSARCKASTPGAAVIDGSEFSAVAAYAITHSRKLNQRCHYRHCEEPTGRANARPMTGSATKQSIHPRAVAWIACCARNDVLPKNQ